MALSGDAIANLTSSVEDGSFPEADDFLKAELSVQSIPLLLASLSTARDQLGIEIRDISKEQTRDVDNWILQAKKAQDDIARCKLEARQIVEEHERIEATKNTVVDTGNKVHFLESEISFNQALQHELESIGEIGQVLDEANRDLASHSPVQCVERLVSAQSSIGRIAKGPSRSLLEQVDVELRQKACSQLVEALNEIFIVEQDEQHGRIEILAGTPSQADSIYKVPLSQCLKAYTELELIDDALTTLCIKLERFFLPLLSKRTNLYLASVKSQDEGLIFSLASSQPKISTLLQIVEDVLVFLQAALPHNISKGIANQLTPKLILSLITNWLDHAVPHELSELNEIHTLRSQVAKLESRLKSFSWPGHRDLNDWIDRIPRTWLNKRRMLSLDAVRSAFRSATNTTRQVERVERQRIGKQDDLAEANADEDDWSANWDDEQVEEQAANSNGREEDEDEASGWDFETESNNSDTGTKPKPTRDNEDDAGEAWGWGDESPTEADKKIDASAAKVPVKERQGSSEQQEIVLTELYTITDIPDYVLEVIGKDISDSQTLRSSSDDTIFTSSAPISALQALPTLVLAMFRATAPTHYSHSRTLSNMNLYNDVSYIVQKVTETTDKDTRSILQPTLDAMQKFARQTYTRELDTQRTILSDLLDGAQGFVSCNSDQFRQLSANAVSAVVDRIKQLHQEYMDVLGQSHLLQTIGSLIGMVIGKVIGDIEDLEDISEKESGRLVEYCRQITSLGDLFVAARPATELTSGPNQLDTTETAEVVSTIAVYVPNYFRFQYLTEILESSLADIKFMWIEGGLKSDFSAEEVIDLIKALFAESTHRRNAISAIRGST